MSKGTKGYRCQCCHEPVQVSWHVPTSCKECGASFSPRPQRTSTVVFFVAAAVAVGVVALARLAIDMTSVLVILGLCVGVVAFNALEVILFRVGTIRLTNVNAPDDTDGIRLATYAGTDKRTRAAQAKQLRESIELARSLRSGGVSDDALSDDAPEHPMREEQGVQAERVARVDMPVRRVCRFRRLPAGNERGIRVMSALATRIVREHFDPIIGTEQNDYMLARYQTPEAIAAQIDEGYEYYFVLPPKEVTAEGEAHEHANGDDRAGRGRSGRVRPIGFLAIQGREDGELYLSKFYLVKEERGKGYARSMVELVARRAYELGCDHVRLNVNRNNYQAILAYEHLGFRRMGEARTDIGGGFVMDDFVYELAL